MNKVKQLNQDYVLGLDLGNTNVGMTAIDEKFNIIKYHNQKEQQVKIFDEAKTAEKRRTFRSSRRNLNHKQARLNEFNSYIKPYLDKLGVDTKSLFNAYKYSFVSASDLALKLHRPKIKRYLANGDYKNFWFAINDLINDNFEGTDAERAQLIYECLYVLIKHRGNFLLNNTVESFAKGNSLNNSFKKINEDLSVVFNNNANAQLNLQDLDKIIDTFNNDELNNVHKRKAIAKLMYLPNLRGAKKTFNQRIVNAVSYAVLGMSMQNKHLMYLFNETETTFDPDLKLKIDNSPLYEEQVAQLQQTLSPMQTMLLNDIIDTSNGVAYLEFIQKDKTFVESRLADYKIFKKQLHEYKNLEHVIPNPDKTKLKKILTSYLFYDRTHNSKNGKLSYSQFTDKVNKILSKYIKLEGFAKPQLLNKVLDGLQSNMFLVKTRSGLNATIPHQIYQAIVRQIIETQSKHKGFKWLTKHEHPSELFKDEKYDLERFIDFRIPYYVGPLTGKKNRSSEHAWAIYKDNKPQKLSVFNLEEILDLPKTANNFIKRQIANDSYLLNEKVMPASSLLYQEFTVLNELNIVMVKQKQKVKGWKRLTYEQKQAVINGLFKVNKTVTTKKFLSFLQEHFPNDFEFDMKKPTTEYVSGLSDLTKFNSTYNTYILFESILGEDFESKFTEQELLKITDILTVFDRESLMLKRQELSKIKKLTSKQIDKLAQQSLTGWGSLSYKLFNQLTDLDNNTIMDLLRNETINLSTVLAKPDFKKQIEKHRTELFNSFKNTSDMIDFIIQEAYLSPSNKRSVKQAIKQIQRTVKFNNRIPKMIVVENARGHSDSKEASLPKVARIKAMLTNAKENEMLDELKPYLPSSKRKSTQKPFGLREYLYFRQLGRNIYKPEEKLSLNKLNEYEIDHINPQSMNGKDNSLDNLVLTTHEMNQKKSNHHKVVLNATNNRFWLRLYDENLLTKYQYQQLNTDWGNATSGFKQKFLRRSLVEINQVNKVTISILHQLYPDTILIGMNSSLPAQLRHMFNLPKVRMVNYYHHGVDSYLIAFAGLYLWKLYPSLHSLLNYFDYNQFGKNNVKDIKLSTFGFKALVDNKHVYVKNGIIINKDGEIVGKQAILQKLLTNKANPKHMSMYYVPTNDNSHDSYFNATKYGRNTPHKEELAIPLKNNLNTQVYGYYRSATTDYMKLVRINKGETTKYKFVPVRIIDAGNEKKIKHNIEVLLNTNKYVILNEHVRPNATVKVGNDILRIASSENIFFKLQVHLHQKSMEILADIDNANNDEINYVFKDVLNFIKQHSILTKYRSYYRNILDNQDKFINSDDLDLKKRELSGIFKNLQSNKQLDTYKKEDISKKSVMRISPMNNSFTSFDVEPIILD